MKVFRQALTLDPDRLAADSCQGEVREEEDSEFRDFIESISLSQEEILALLAMPELTVEEVRRLFVGPQDVSRQ